jgi:isoquinoline 1-oxidoreductase subunit alpha
MPPPTALLINGQLHRVQAPGPMPLLWALRDHLGLMGTKYGCGQGLCGACTVLVDGVPQRACQLPLAQLGKRAVTTVEGLDDPVAKAVKDQWLAHNVAQRGYCQGGQIMAATVLLRVQSRPSEADIDAAFAGHLCRCGSYPRIRAAVHAAARQLRERATGGQP